MRAGPAFGGLDARSVELGAVGRQLWRKKWWVLAPTFVVVAIAAVAVNMVTPRFKSEARALIEGRENVFLRPEAEKRNDRAILDQEAITSRVQLVLSRDVARQVIRQLKLGELSEFDPLLRGTSPVAHMLQVVGLAKDPLRMTPEERVLNSYYDRLNVYAVDKSRVIAVEFQSYDPDLAARAANAVVDDFVALQLAAQQEETRSAGRWLAGEIEVLRQKVADAEAKVEEFRSKSNLFVGTNNTTLSAQQLGELNSQLAAARSQKADAEAKAKFIRDTLKSGKSLESADFLNSELIRRLSEQLATVRGQLAEQSSTLLDNHPRIKELRAQVADLDRQLRTEAERLARALENDARIAGARVEALSENLSQVKQQAATTNEQDIQLRAYEREAKAQRDLLESYLARYREVTSRDSLGAVPSDVRVISRAIVSNTPFFPKKVPIVLIAGLAMLLIASGFIVTGQLMATMPVRAAVPAELHDPYFDRDEPHLDHIADAAPVAPEAMVPDPYAEDIAALAHEIAASPEAGRRIVVVGAQRDIGTTLTALALARELARDTRVVLVDLAFAHPNLAAVAIDPSAPGIADLVRGGASFGAVITRDRDSRAHIVPAGRGGPDNAAILASERIGVALDALGRTYDHVIVDAGTTSEPLPDPLLRGSPRAVLVVAGVPREAALAARDRLHVAGFADIAMVGAAPPAAAIAAPEQAAAA
ncbi:MAG: lipopolysaccharide biosynthesis protein [Bradyrhizobiaceae bacterium]|nr:lipopolysaccharide biosynthesis protein [Hyphomicrobiales bacterium]MBV9426535.1 lipopolysaccharide biosynthesis protein [Bradyrhizobiaceae bacterium]